MLSNTKICEMFSDWADKGAPLGVELNIPQEMQEDRECLLAIHRQVRQAASFHREKLDDITNLLANFGGKDADEVKIKELPKVKELFKKITAVIARKQ